MSKKILLSEINWDDVPSEFKYVAVDSDGDAYAYVNEPHCVCGTWDNQPGDISSMYPLENNFRRSEYGQIVERVSEEETVEDIININGEDLEVVATEIDEDEWEAMCDEHPAFVGEGDTADEAIEDLEDQLVEDLIADQEYAAKDSSDAQEDLDRIVEWFQTNTDLDTDDVDGILTRLDQLIAAEDTLHNMIADYQEGQQELDQDKFVN